jgi:hypothetical protein
MALFLPELQQLLLVKRFLQTLFGAPSNLAILFQRRYANEFSLLKLPREFANFLVVRLQKDNLFADW